MVNDANLTEKIGELVDKIIVKRLEPIDKRLETLEKGQKNKTEISVLSKNS